MVTSQYKFPRDERNPIRGKYLPHSQRKLLEENLKRKDLSNKKRQRLTIILLADEGKTQAEICQATGCSQATARYWISRARNGSAEHWNSNFGRPAKITPDFKKDLKQLISQNPKETHLPNQSKQIIDLANQKKHRDEICQATGCSQATARYWISMARNGFIDNQKLTYSIERWNARILSEHLHGVYGIKVTPQYINKLLKQMGLSTRSKPIQIFDLDNVSVVDASEMWNFNHLTIN